jgi:MFS family permease
MSTHDQVIEHHHKRRWIVVFSAALFFFYEFIQMHMFNAISGSLMADFHVNAGQLGNLSAMYLYADVVFLLPAGIILDRVSTRKVVLAALALCILGTAGFAISTQYWFAAACHFLAGIGNAFCFLSCIRLASRWFPTRMLAFVIGLIVTLAMLGGLAAETPLTILTHHFSWRNVVLLNALFGVVVYLIIFINVRDFPKGYEQQYAKQQHQLHDLGFLASIKLALGNIQNWLAGLYTAFLNLPLMLLCALWGNMYLEQVHHLTDIQSSNVVSMIFVGTIIGGPVIGAWSDKISLRKFPMVIGAILSIFAILVLTEFAYLGYHALLLLFFFIGFCTSAQVLAYPLITESNNRIVSSTATGLASVLIMGAPALFQPIFGMIMDHYWTGKILNNVHVYTNMAFEKAMLIFPATFVLAFLAACFVRETNCREYNSKHQSKP